MKAGDNAARLADCIALECRGHQAVYVTIRLPAVNAVVSVKLSGDRVAMSKSDAVCEAAVAFERK